MWGNLTWLHEFACSLWVCLSINFMIRCNLNDLKRYSYIKLRCRHKHLFYHHRIRFRQELFPNRRFANIILEFVNRFCVLMKLILDFLWNLAIIINQVWLILNNDLAFIKTLDFTSKACLFINELVERCYINIVGE